MLFLLLKVLVFFNGQYLSNFSGSINGLFIQFQQKTQKRIINHGQRNYIFNRRILITCVVESGLADKIIDAAYVGAQGGTINYARGTGVRDRMGLMGVTIDEQKEIIRIIVSKSNQTEYLNLCF